MTEIHRPLPLVFSFNLDPPTTQSSHFVFYPELEFTRMTRSTPIFLTLNVSDLIRDFFFYWERKRETERVYYCIFFSIIIFWTGKHYHKICHSSEVEVTILFCFFLFVFCTDRPYHRVFFILRVWVYRLLCFFDYYKDNGVSVGW